MTTTICAWCEHEKPSPAAGQGDDAKTSSPVYGICTMHAARLVEQLHKYYPPRTRRADRPEASAA